MQDEAAYIEAAPQSAAAEPHTANGSTQQLAEQDPQRLKALHSEQAGAQQQRQPVPSKAAGPSRAKPRVKAGARANKAAAAEAANAGQTAGPETANGSADPRLARLLQETNVTAEDWREEGVY